MANCIITHTCPALWVANPPHTDEASIATGPSTRGSSDTELDESVITSSIAGLGKRRRNRFRAGDSYKEWRPRIDVADRGQHHRSCHAPEPGNTLTDIQTSTDAMQHDHHVGFRSGPVMQVDEDNLSSIVELSSPRSLHQVVREESRHSDTRSVSLGTTAVALDTIEPVTLKSESIEESSLRRRTRVQWEGVDGEHDTLPKRGRGEASGSSLPRRS